MRSSSVTTKRLQAIASPYNSTFGTTCLISYNSSKRRCLYNNALRHDQPTSRISSRNRTNSIWSPRVQQSPASQTLVKSCRTKSTQTAIDTREEYNPPRSTLPPEVAKVERGDKSLPSYLWQLARTYGTFYKTGGKAIFTNRTLAAQVREKVKKATNTQIALDPFDTQLLAAAIKADTVTRSDFQLLRRHGHDFARLPLFGVLILLMGEWLPLFVPFIPYAVPLTCRIPSQIEEMRTKVEQRRKTVFRQGIAIPSEEQLKVTIAEKLDREWLLLDQSLIRPLLARLTSEQIWYLSCVLNLHSRLWESVQLRPPVWMMRSRLTRKLQYIAQDDVLLTRGGKNAASLLSEEELRIACEERGLDVLKPSSKQLQQQLAGWLRRQMENVGRGTAVIDMLFRRPNSWS